MIGHLIFAIRGDRPPKLRYEGGSNYPKSQLGAERLY